MDRRSCGRGGVRRLRYRGRLAHQRRGRIRARRRPRRGTGRSAGTHHEWRLYPPTLLRVMSGSALTVAGRTTPDDPRRSARRGRLSPWPDSRDGPSQLRETDITATLSNGSTALLIHFARAGRLPFDIILRAELIHSYKPDPKVMAAELLEVSPRRLLLIDRLPCRGSACRGRRRTAHRIHSTPAGMGPRPSGPGAGLGRPHHHRHPRPGPATHSIAADPTPPGQFSEARAEEVRLHVPTDLLIGVGEIPALETNAPALLISTVTPPLRGDRYRRQAAAVAPGAE